MWIWHFMYRILFFPTTEVRRKRRHMLMCISANGVSFLLTFCVSAMWFSLYCTISVASEASHNKPLETSDKQNWCCHHTVRNPDHLLHNILIYCDLHSQHLKEVPPISWKAALQGKQKRNKKKLKAFPDRLKEFLFFFVSWFVCIADSSVLLRVGCRVSTDLSVKAVVVFHWKQFPLICGLVCFAAFC